MEFVKVLSVLVALTSTAAASSPDREICEQGKASDAAALLQGKVQVHPPRDKQQPRDKQRTSVSALIQEHYTRLFLLEEARQQGLQRHLEAEGSAWAEKPAESVEEVSLKQTAPIPEEVGIHIGNSDLTSTSLNFTQCDAQIGGKDAWHAGNGCVLGSDGQNQCEWHKLSSGLHFCCRSYPDLLSDRVKSTGAWDDCPALLSWWTVLQDRSGQGGAEHEKLFVDVGANIGSCLLFMMAQPGVHQSLAFEPNPGNQFYLTNSVLANPDIREKVKLYPFALGDKDEAKPIYMEAGNAGNTVVGQAVQTSAQPVGEIKIKKLDDLVFTGATPPYIHLMKFDAQGYEVKIMKGASKLFASGVVNAVKFELATEWLIKQGTSSAEFLNTFLSYGFQIHDTKTKQLVSQELLHAKACGPNIVEDFVAVAGEAAIQKPIDCDQAAGGDQQQAKPQPGMQLYPSKLFGGSDGSSCQLPNGASWCTVKPATGRNFEMAVYKENDIVSGGICSNGFWEVSDVSDLGTPGTALDIGANIGFYSFLLADAGWEVASFEVLPKNQELIQATACRNPHLAEKITLHRTGLGPRDDNCVFVSGRDNAGDGMVQCGDDAKRIQSAKGPIMLDGNEYINRGSFSVKRLDDILMLQGAPANIDFVKIDVEGFECQVFKGADSILKQYRPRKIQSEVWPKMQACQNSDYLNMFKQANYEVAKTRNCETPDATLSGSIQDFFMCRK